MRTPNDDLQQTYDNYVREKIRRGLKDVAEGRVISQEEAERRFERWLSKRGEGTYGEGSDL